MAGTESLELGDLCGLYIDMPLGEAGPASGDWIATPAGSRYLVETVRLVRPRAPRPVSRWQLRVHRLRKHTDPPADVRVIWLSWYARKRR